jgi:hypothetical protein
MATISRQLTDSNGAAVVGATVRAYTASSQPPPPLEDAGGAALDPVGAAASTSVTDSNGVYTLSGLVAATPYHLYITPPTS